MSTVVAVRNAERHAQTRALLIDAAWRAFSDSGYEGAATESIVKTAGVTRGALYYHFKDKRALFEGVFEHAEAELVDRIAARARTSADPLESIVRGCLAFVDTCLEPRFRRVILADGPSVLGWPTWRAIDARYGLASLTAAVEEAIEHGALATKSPLILASLISGATNEGVFLVAEAPNRRSARKHVEDGLRRLIFGLRT